MLEQRRAEHARVDDRLARAVGAGRIHDVRGVAEQRHLPSTHVGSGSRSIIGYSNTSFAPRSIAGTSSQS